MGSDFETIVPLDSRCLCIFPGTITQELHKIWSQLERLGGGHGRPAPRHSPCRYPRLLAWQPSVKFKIKSLQLRDVLVIDAATFPQTRHRHPATLLFRVVR